MTTAVEPKRKTEKRSESRLVAAPTMRLEITVFKIVGTSPLLQNNPAEFIGKTEGSDLAAKKNYDDMEEAMLRVYRDGDGNFCHPAEAFLRSMVRAVTGKKFGRVSAPSLIRGAVFLAESMVMLECPDGTPLTTFSIDRRSVVINKRARVLRCRPVWPEWSLRLPLEINTALVSKENISDALALAGVTVGVGDFRPEKGGGFGRFQCEL
jgi:hypothetical protein